MSRVQVSSTAPLKPRGSPRGFFVVSGFLVFGGAGRGPVIFPEAVAWVGWPPGMLWLSDDLTAGLSDNLTVWSPDYREAVQEKIFKKIWDAKRAGEGVKLLSEPPRSCFGG